MIRLLRFTSVLLLSAFALLTAEMARPLVAAPALQPAAPESLRCPGRALPEPPERWRFEWQWESLDAYQFPGTAGDDGPYAVALDRGCNLYVADSQNNQVVKVSPEGEVLARFSTPRGAPGESSSPRGIAVDAQGNIYVTDTPRNHILKLSPSGQVIATWGTCTPSAQNSFCDPTQPGLFVDPQGIAVDGTGAVYVIEVAGNRIQKLTSDGVSVAVWPAPGLFPGDLFILGEPAIDAAGNLYVPDEYNNRVLKLSSDGALLQQIGGGPDPSADPGRFHGPRGVAVDQAGNIYVSDRDNWRVQKLAADGTFIDQWRLCLDPPTCSLSTAGQGLGEFFAARGLTVDGQGNLYVADTANKRVQRLIATPVPVPPPSGAP